LSVQFYAQNKRNSSGKREGKWVFTGKDLPQTGVSKDTKVEEGYYVNGRKQGQWTKYYKDGKTPKLKGNYSDNRPEGPYTRYHTNGKIAEQGTFGKNGYKGPLTRYYENGQVAYKANFNNEGQESGLVQHFHPNGRLALSYTVKAGEVRGKVARYDQQGQLLSSFQIDDTGKIGAAQKASPKQVQVVPHVGQTQDVTIYPPHLTNPKMKGLRFVPNGYNKVYNANDEIWMDGEFKNGQLFDGKVYDYDQDGILQKVRIFKNGKYHSEGQL
jgi:antitoxin component YwqK of YwqJK toxin-antitoxin module